MTTRQRKRKKAVLSLQRASCRLKGLVLAAACLCAGSLSVRCWAVCSGLDSAPVYCESARFSSTCGATNLLMNTPWANITEVITSQSLPSSLCFALLPNFVNTNSHFSTRASSIWWGDRRSQGGWRYSRQLRRGASFHGWRSAKRCCATLFAKLAAQASCRRHVRRDGYVRDTHCDRPERSYSQ